MQHFDPAELPPGLLEEYRRGAGDQLAQVAALADRLSAAPDDRVALDALRREAHRINGSAGSFGFPEASRLAAGMEATVKDWLATPAGGDTVTDRGALARWFVVRLAETLQVEVPATTRTDRPTAPATPRFSEITAVPDIIVVEDDPALAELLEYGLNSRGYAFTLLRNGREALEYLRTLPTTDRTPLLLLDVDLPGLDGYSVFEALQRERPGTYRTVFTTVHGGEEEQLRGLEAGALDYLVKPISLRVVLEKIRRWVGH